MIFIYESIIGDPIWGEVIKETNRFQLASDWWDLGDSDPLLAI